MKPEEIDDIYELSPLQQGMLFHSLAAAGSGVYVLQFVCPLTGELDLDAFRRAWERMTARHSVLRTSFHWQELDKPLQVVQHAVELPLAQLDWQSLTAAEQEPRLAALLHDDRQQGFALTQGPLVRLTLIRLDKDLCNLILTVHHIVLDGWCLGLLLRELLELYEGFRQGREVRLPPVRPYAEYIDWLQSRDAAETEAYWRGMLAGFTTPTPLSVDHPAAEGEEGVLFGEEGLLVPAALVSDLQSFAARRQLTLSTLVQGAWVRLLAEYSGEEDVLYGSVVAGRPPDFPGIESMIGLFVNTLPVRARLSGSQETAEWLRDFQRLQLDLRRFEHSSLIDVQGWSEVPRGRPLFESLFAFENYPRKSSVAEVQESRGALRLGNVRTYEQTNYPMTVAVGPGRELSLRASFDRARFEAPAVKRMLHHLRALLAGLVGVAERPLAEWSCLTAPEHHQLLREWNDVAATVPPWSPLELLAERTRLQPDAPALVDCDHYLTYGELSRRATALARHLATLGVGPEIRVALCVPRSVELVVAMAGVLEAGGAFVPLDPAYPSDRLGFLVGDSAAAVLLTVPELLPALSGLTARVVCLDPSLLPADGDEGFSREADLDGLAYVIYTSGSTGLPKGVAVRHGGLTNLVLWHERTHGITPSDHLSQVASPAFDAAVWEIWASLASGATLHLADEATRLSSARLVEWVVERGITSGFLPTPLAEAALAEDWPAVTPLRSLLTGGDRLRCGAPGAGFRLLNHYGPTESTVVGTWCPVPRQEDLAGVPPIGRPISNLRAYLLDRRGWPVPVGVAGEVCLTGAGLARGYLGRPELTAASFVPDPWAGQPGARLYRTGDLGRFLPDGRIEFLGRVDRQVKVRGFRIEPGEIEAMLARHASVREAVVVQGEDGALVGYAVKRPEADVSEPVLRAFLREHLPEHMVPQALLLLDSLPLTSNGKVDWRALVSPVAGGGQALELTAPRNDLERTIAAAWQEVLGLQMVGVEQSFFDLGGHSMLVLQVQKRLEQALKRPLAVTDLFRYSTIARLAEHLAGGEADESVDTGQQRAEARRASLQRRRRSGAVKEIEL
ncbi:MAG TPA: amino acid adenylation domain-containing protein [Thermoanaerobaculia bacterium]|nr:amino acid adenylation domain-containing protein [Thermoanaerobaculia bacterium]